MWSCCPSTLSPAVGPSVLSDAGEPASPNAPAVPTNAIIAGVLNPNSRARGTNMAASMGTVPKEVPIPIVIIRPIKSITIAAINLLPPIIATLASTNASTPPVALITSPYPAATNITKAINPMIPIPPFNTSSISFQPNAPKANIIAKPTTAPKGSEPTAICITKAATAPSNAPMCALVKDVEAVYLVSASITTASSYSLGFLYVINTAISKPIIIPEPGRSIDFHTLVFIIGNPLSVKASAI